MRTKYNLGDFVYYVYSSIHMETTIDCPICFGKGSVVIILGNGEHQNTECDYCGHGLDRATGKVKTWEPKAEIKSGIIIGISTKNHIPIYDVGCSFFEEQELFSSEEEANPKLKEELKSVQERAKKWFIDSFRLATKKQTWSVGYHKRCIKDAKRTIDWHNERLRMIKGQDDERKRS